MIRIVLSCFYLLIFYFKSYQLESDVCRILKVARLDFFWGGYLPSLSVNYVAMSKDMEKRLPQVYYYKTVS